MPVVYSMADALDSSLPKQVFSAPVGPLCRKAEEVLCMGALLSSFCISHVCMVYMHEKVGSNLGKTGTSLRRIQGGGFYAGSEVKRIPGRGRAEAVDPRGHLVYLSNYMPLPTAGV